MCFRKNSGAVGAEGQGEGDTCNFGPHALCGAAHYRTSHFAGAVLPLLLWLLPLRVLLMQASPTKPDEDTRVIGHEREGTAS